MSDSRANDLLRAKNLIKEGRVDEALLIVEILEKKKGDLDLYGKRNIADGLGSISTIK